ncbi:MAG TPA: tRNA epoxyqueuosine(34) reductase QueG [Candidatus Paceibacterota bacterium]|nr:tRNA epoxyqueuosine(34) reductase QueG [Verrucomicrobiota bacterium]HSA09239.1 tRNA epoxyqueuosine(34) reductase QueG [Candidatus Paceibacterota bacterium]
MKTALRERARELGFDDCRVTTAAAPESAARFRQWLTEGRQGEMGWLARNVERRVDPQQVLPGARSIIALAASYSLAGQGARSERQVPTATRTFSAGPSDTHHAPRTTPLSVPPAGIIARYARYADYHEVLGERLRQLAQFVDGLGEAGTRSLWYVDTGPVLERDLAQRAGLGFIGKHTNLISRRSGNWILLAEILTTLGIEPDAPEKNRCGACARCITACPTAAITAPFQLDARRCISYLTIELKGGIPLELRPAMSDRIFGCDDCLAVCPWNRFAQEARLMKAHARPDLAQPDLLELLALDEAGFKQRFAGTPIVRARRRGLLRNVCVALGNVGGEGALPALRIAARDPEPLVSEHARWAIEQIEARRRARY